MQYKVNYTIKAEVFDKLKQETINFTVDKEITLDEPESLLYDNYHLVGSGSIYEHLDHEIDMYAKAEGMALKDLRIDFFEVFCDDDQLEIFFAHPENKNEFTLYPDLYIHMFEKPIEALKAPTLSAELLTPTTIKWSFDIPDEYLNSCGHYIYDENDELIAQLPVGLNYTIESELEELKNYTRKVRRYTTDKISEASNVLTITTQKKDVKITEKKIRPFEKDWYNETDFELKTNERLKAFQSGVGSDEDLKVLDLSVTDIDKNLPVMYKLYGTKNKFSYRKTGINTTLSMVKYNDGSPRSITNKKNYAINGYNEDSASLGKRNVNITRDFKVYTSEHTSFLNQSTIDEIIAIQKDDDPYTNDKPRVDEYMFDSFRLFINFNIEDVVEEDIELLYVTEEGERIDLEYYNKDSSETFDLFIKNKLIQGIIPIENDFYQRLHDEPIENITFTAYEIESILTRFELGYKEKKYEAIGLWESDQYQADVIERDIEKETIEYEIKKPQLIDFDLKMNERIVPLYLSKYIDNPNYNITSSKRVPIRFDGDTLILEDRYEFNKSINPMNPVINKGFYYLNNQEMYMYNDHELKNNKTIKDFKNALVTAVINYELTIGNEVFRYAKNIGKTIILNGEEQPLTDKTLREIIEEDISNLKITEYDEMTLLDVELTPEINNNGPFTLDSYIAIFPPIEGDSFEYDNIIEVVDNEYVIETFDNIDQEKIILKIGDTPLKRFLNEEDDSSLKSHYKSNGTGKKTYRLPQIDIDHESIQIKLNDELTNEFKIHNNNISFSNTLSKEDLFEIEYKLNNSFVIFKDIVGYKIKINTDLTGDYRLYYEKDSIPNAKGSVYLNPLYSGITEGYLYVDNHSQNIKRFDVEMNDKSLKRSTNEITFGKIIAIDDFGNKCPGIKIFYDIQYGEIELINGDITNENGCVSFLYRPPKETCEDLLIVTHPDINEIKKVVIDVQ